MSRRGIARGGVPPGLVRGTDQRVTRRTLGGPEVAMLAVIGLVVSYLAVVSLRLQIDYYDGYENLLGARAILDRNPAEWAFYRAILYPLLQLPATTVGRIVGSTGVAFALGHLSAILLFGILLVVTFRLLRMQLDVRHALLGTTLLSINLLIINNAPMAKEDIPGAAFITAALYVYWRARRSPSFPRFLSAGLLAGMAAGLRYPLLPLWLAFILGFELLSAILSLKPARAWASVWNGRWVLRMAALGITPVVLLFLFPIVLDPIIGRSTLLGAPRLFLHDLRVVRDAVLLNDGTIQNYRFIANSLTWPLILPAIAGALIGWRTNRSATLFHSLWFVLLFGVQTYAIGHKEARFLFPVFPSVYFFVAQGMATIPSLATRLIKSTQLRRGLTLALIGALLVAPVVAAFGALLRFTDPVYATDYEAAVSRYATSLQSGGHVYWLGPVYPLHPRSYHFDPKDPFTYIYHAYPHIVTYWTGVSAQPFPSVSLLQRDGVVYPDQGMLALLGDGDAVIVDLEPRAYAQDAPLWLEPLVVERAVVLTLSKDPAAPTSFRLGSASIVTAREGAATLLRGTGLPDGDFVLADSANGWPQLPIAQAMIQVRQGRFELSLPAEVWSSLAPNDSLRLVAFDAVRSFAPPGQ